VDGLVGLVVDGVGRRFDPGPSSIVGEIRFGHFGTRAEVPADGWLDAPGHGEGDWNQGNAGGVCRVFKNLVKTVSFSFFRGIEVQGVGFEGWSVTPRSNDDSDKSGGRIAEEVTWNGDGGEIVVVVAMRTNDARLVVGVGTKHGKREGLNSRALPIGGRGDENELIGEARIDLHRRSRVGGGGLCHGGAEGPGIVGIVGAEARDRHDARNSPVGCRVSFSNWIVSER
jgi:hypothetical protein